VLQVIDNDANVHKYIKDIDIESEVSEKEVSNSEEVVVEEDLISKRKLLFETYFKAPDPKD